MHIKTHLAAWLVFCATAHGQSLAPEAQRVSGASLVPGTRVEASVAARLEDGRAVLVYEAADASVRRPAYVVAGELVAWSPSLPPAQARAQLDSGLRSLAPEVELVRQIPGRSVFLLRARGAELIAPAVLADRVRSHLPPAFELEPNIAFRAGANQDFLGTDLEQGWALRNVGEGGGLGGKTPDADVDGMEALTQLRLMRTPPKVRPVVAVLDSGLDMRHPSLSRNLWRNDKEIPGNGIDDDDNGFVDDVHGADFLSMSGEPWDWNGHGTHVAGLIAAVPPRAQQLGAASGLAPWALVMPLRVLSGAPGALFAPLFSVADAMTYARAKGAVVVNMSFESYAYSRLMQDEVQRNWAAGIDQAAAAGNGVPDGKGADLLGRPVYPCVLPFVACVAATDNEDKVTPFSNYGTQPPFSRIAHLAAPGDNILSTWPGGTHRYMSGTSMATPMVAAVMGNIRALYPEASWEERRLRLVGGGDRPRTLIGKTWEARRLNAYQAMFGNAPASSSVYEHSAYCAERVLDPLSGNFYPRWTNYPYANSNERPEAQEFMICTARQLMSVRDEHLGRHFGLAQDIDWAQVGPTDIAPIGARARNPSEPLSLPFTGRFNGYGHAIVGMEMPGRFTGALFGEIGPGAVVSNLRLREVRMTAVDAAGALAVAMTGGLVSNVEAEGRIEARRVAGGLVAEQRAGAIDAPFYSGTVVSHGTAGGIVGHASGRDERRPYTFRRAFFSGTVQAPVAGGLVGLAELRSVVNGHALGMVSGSTTGGLAGVLGCGATLSVSYAVARVQGTSEAGGIVGRMSKATLRDAYAEAQVERNAPHNGGAVGRVLDTVACAPASQAPATSQLQNVFFSANGANPSSLGTPLTFDQMRDKNAYPASWRDAHPSWRFVPGFMPALNKLPRSFDFTFVQPSSQEED